MTVQMLEDDIANGIPENPCRCPVALAMRRNFPGHSDEIVVHCEMVWVYTKLYKLSPNAVKFISDFDSGQEVEPIIFEVTEEKPFLEQLLEDKKNETN